MRAFEEQKEMVAALKSVYESIQFHGIYAKYTRSISVLSQLLSLDDPAELHYVMMHLSRLSYLKNSDNTYVWGSERYVKLVGCSDLSALTSQLNADFLDQSAESELQKMETQALQFQQISTNLFDTRLKGRGHFICHVKIYPVYNQKGRVHASLGILTELANHQRNDFIPQPEANKPSALLI